jgi:hypothetical protein
MAAEASRYRFWCGRLRTGSIPEECQLCGVDVSSRCPTARATRPEVTMQVVRKPVAARQSDAITRSRERAGSMEQFRGPRDNASIALLDFGNLRAGPVAKFTSARNANSYSELNGLGDVKAHSRSADLTNIIQFIGSARTSRCARALAVIPALLRTSRRTPSSP